ncbi:hypothetical protein [Salmonella enterica]|uniref:hypothetical protein n=1 Tax=Salmonella enterica TaxID=28901 RepID=UPI0009B04E52|nr:hypothetical protein [Salmonella enterica]UTL05069.1 hypothetical protein NL707_22885 [Salmonella enterica subsp. enterica serovar Montevideo]
MKKTIVFMVLVSAFAMNTYADDVNNGYAEMNKASSYIQCGLFAEVSNIHKDNQSNIQETNARVFRMLALKHWRIGSKLIRGASTGDNEIVDFAAYLSSLEAVTWDVVPEMNKSSNNGRAAIAAYNNANCDILLEAAK